MTQLELGWLSGVIESEGCIGVFKNNFISRSAIKVNYLPQISITNSDTILLERCQRLILEATGLHRPIIQDRSKKNPNHRKCMKIIIGNYAAIIKVLDLIFPSLCAKKKQASLVRALAIKCIGNKGRGISVEEREMYYHSVRFLNSGHLRESRTTNTPDINLLIEKLMKIESELTSNRKSRVGDSLAANV